VIADAAKPEWHASSASDLIETARGIVTTPSTVAFDAARAERPVAVVGYDLDLAAYAPLHVLRSGADWIAFVRHLGDARERANHTTRARSFRDRWNTPGDSVGRILATVTGAASDPRATIQ
jgi:hypothetical protein